MQCVAVSRGDQMEREVSNLQEANHSEPPLNGRPSCLLNSHMSIILFNTHLVLFLPRKQYLMRMVPFTKASESS